MPSKKSPGVPNRNQVSAGLPLCLKDMLFLTPAKSEEKVSRKNPIASYGLKIPLPDKMESHVRGVNDVRWGLVNLNHSDYIVKSFSCCYVKLLPLRNVQESDL
jgi:hypothetical protein